MRFREIVLPLLFAFAAVPVFAAEPVSSVRQRLPADLRPPFRWQASKPLFQPPTSDADEYYSLKDPSIVFYQGHWHMFCTVRAKQRSHQIEYLRFADFNHPERAERNFLVNHAGFYCAPQVFFFRPQQKWYLICQASDPAWEPEYGPAFTTTQEIADVASWTPLQPLGYRRPESKAGLDFWVICDTQKAYLFFTSLDGRMWREETRLEDFPHGWSEPVIALEADVFEASHTYKIRGADVYLTLIEAQAAKGRRYYKAYIADRLDGAWQPLADRESASFADGTNIRFTAGRWSDSVSHGELLRAEYDERLEIRPENLKFVFQGVAAADAEGKPYGEIPWQLGLLSVDETAGR